MGLFRATDPAALADTPFNYAEVGATAAARLPSGYRTATYATVVGSGRADLERASAAVLDWRAQRSVGFRVRASGPAGTPGTVVVLTAGLPRLGYELPCRVVWAATDGDERGFSYGTLAGHPESGEERFTVRLLPGGEVEFEIRVFFRLATRAARLAGPLSLGLQRLGTQRYLSAIRRAARG
ncbi:MULTISPECIES: DUF1990 domain-containing protein [unclassified Blastococcus]|uniref:DUF1990 family protein n=1 Tax=unclassified Blastococcus TaxID=2619396 RepID=UPI00281575CA|nr:MULTISPECIES: DUF1990 domain-containing protein [unclassified Blastococcus]